MKKVVLPQLATISVQAGERGGFAGAPTLPVWQTATFTFRDFAEIEEFCAGASSKSKYGRYGNPPQKACEAKLAALEAAEGALLFPSGMSAITTTLLALLRAGDHAIYSHSLYRNTTRFFEELLPLYGVATTAVPADDLKALEDALTPQTRVAFFEIPTNLFLRVPDVPRLASTCKKARSSPLLVVDSTFATPYCFRPLDHGADLALHSLTKYLGGHDDLLAGCVCGSDRLLDTIAAFRDVMGGICDPHNTFLCLRSLKTFPLRMARLSESGQQIAEFLADQQQVQRIFYPGLPSHPDHLVARRLLGGYGSVVYFEISGGKAASRRFIEALQLPFIGSNFGGVHTFVEPFSRLTFGKATKAQRATLGVGENLVRMCVGLEAPVDLTKDLKQALNRAARR